MFHTVILLIHVLGACVMVGASIMCLHLALTKTITKDIVKSMGTIKSLVPAAAIVQLVTGILLYLYEPDKFRVIPYFWLKISVFIVLSLYSQVITLREVKRFMTGKEEQNTKLRTILIIEGILLLLIVSIGVWLVEN